MRFYGTQRSRPPWDAEFAELWELRERGGAWVREHRLASWETMPMSLAQDSESGEATADLVDVGAGTAEGDYTGKDVRGRIVVASSPPGEVARLAVERHGARGLVSYAQNQRTAWWGENENLVRWGHLGTFAPKPTFAFMVSLKQARDFQRRLKGGERIRLTAAVRAGKHEGAYEIVEATIPGADPVLKREEIVFTCHLDHPAPGRTTTPAAPPPSSRWRGQCRSWCARAASRRRRGPSASCGRPRSKGRWRCPTAARSWPRASRPPSTWTWWAAVPRPRRSSTSRADRRACRRSCTTWPRRSGSS